MACTSSSRAGDTKLDASPTECGGFNDADVDMRFASADSIQSSGPVLEMQPARAHVCKVCANACHLALAIGRLQRPRISACVCCFASRRTSELRSTSTGRPPVILRHSLSITVFVTVAPSFMWSWDTYGPPAMTTVVAPADDGCEAIALDGIECQLDVTLGESNAEQTYGVVCDRPFARVCDVLRLILLMETGNCAWPQRRWSVRFCTCCCCRRRASSLR